jgi:hypothetical protein
MAVSLMCENLKKQRVDVNKMALIDPDHAIRFIHSQYRMAKKSLRSHS